MGIFVGVRWATKTSDNSTFEIRFFDAILQVERNISTEENGQNISRPQMSKTSMLLTTGRKSELITGVNRNKLALQA